MTPEATADPIAKPAGSDPGIHMQADKANQHLVLTLPTGDRKMKGAALGQFVARGQNPIVRKLPRVGEWHDSQISRHLPVVDQSMQRFGILGDQRPQDQPLRRKLREYAGTCQWIEQPARQRG